MLIRKLKDKLKEAEMAGDQPAIEALKNKIEFILTNPPETVSLDADCFLEKPELGFSRLIGGVTRIKVPRTKPVWMSEGRYRAILAQIWEN